jgi:hypothetical protein
MLIRECRVNLAQTEKHDSKTSGIPATHTDGTFCWSGHICRRRASAGDERLGRGGRSLRIDISTLASEHVTFMYPDHFHLVWSKGLFTPDFPYSYQPYHDLLFTYGELPEAIVNYGLSSLIAHAKQQDMWVCSYIEAHIWDPAIRQKIQRKQDAAVNL